MRYSKIWNKFSNLQYENLEKARSAASMAATTILFCCPKDWSNTHLITPKFVMVSKANTALQHTNLWGEYKDCFRSYTMTRENVVLVCEAGKISYVPKCDGKINILFVLHYCRSASMSHQNGQWCSWINACISILLYSSSWLEYLKRNFVPTGFWDSFLKHMWNTDLHNILNWSKVTFTAHEDRWVSLGRNIQWKLKCTSTFRCLRSLFTKIQTHHPELRVQIFSDLCIPNTFKSTSICFGSCIFRTCTIYLTGHKDTGALLDLTNIPTGYATMNAVCRCESRCKRLTWGLSTFSQNFRKTFCNFASCSFSEWHSASGLV